jgi:hypothetical protein
MPHVGRNRSLMACTNKCGWATSPIGCPWWVGGLVFVTSYVPVLCVWGALPSLLTIGKHLWSALRFPIVGYCWRSSIIGRLCEPTHLHNWFGAISCGLGPLPVYENVIMHRHPPSVPKFYWYIIPREVLRGDRLWRNSNNMFSAMQIHMLKFLEMAFTVNGSLKKFPIMHCVKILWLYLVSRLLRDVLNPERRLLTCFTSLYEC